MVSAVRLRRISTALIILAVVSSAPVSPCQQVSPANPSPGKSVQPRTISQASPGPRPRIGLALSGGGALGMAHIGVLQWLEEHRIPVDRIAGTSMGGIVGAIYATGFSPAEMHNFVAKLS